MDQIKTGRFIACERKRKGYTQKQLADLLGISDKTVSKWECGNGFPEVSFLLPLCDELEVSVNELLTGERVPGHEYQKKAEENMMDLVKEAQDNKEALESKKKIILSAIVAGIVIAAAVPLFVVGGVFPMEAWVRCVLLGIGLLIVFAGIAVACILDRDVGAFECPECHVRFVPNMQDYIMGPHTLTKRRLRCPKCGAVKYCKHVLTK